MENDENILILRTRDFWGSLGLMALSIFFLWRTTDIPLFGGNSAGVSGVSWYSSAAIVPLGIFGCLFVLSIVLLSIAIRAGGAKHALSMMGIGWNGSEAIRFVTLGIIMLSYIGGLVPRVDFIIGSGLLISVLIYGYHGGVVQRSLQVSGLMLCVGLYAIISHWPQSEWNAHDDDWVALIAWIGLTVVLLLRSRSNRVLKITPIIAITVPLLLVTAMAFGFRQNVPARGGLIFKQIEYHYYVTLRPIWRD